MRRRGVVRVPDEIHHKPRQAADPLAAHRVPLVRHRRRADLLVLERLINLLAVAEEADVGGDLVEDGGDGGKIGEDEGVDDAGVGLGH